MTNSTPSVTAQAPLNSPFKVLIASLIGTTIEFFDFYVYATAAVLVFPTLFFPSSDPTSAMLQSFATFSIAFFARPVGAVVFGHFGDRIGRKATLVAALLTMGISTVVIGFLPGFNQIGVLAPLLLSLCRFGQGFGLGGEWGGAVLLATENAPEGKRSWYGMFPQLGAPIGLFLSSGIFWVLLHFISQEALLSWGWRIPFISSIVLVMVGLWMRLSITETPEFQKAIDTEERVKVPLAEIFRNHKRSLFLGTFVALVTFVLFYISTAYLMSYNVKVRHIPFLDALAAPFPTSVRYTGASMTFNLAGIVGASLAPYAATWLQSHYGLAHVGYYLLAAAVITLVCILASRKGEV
jgi:MFS family permease